MSSTGILASLLKFTWKVALTLTAVGCGCYIARRAPFPRLRMGTPLGRRARPQAQVDESRQAAEALRAHLEAEGARARAEAEQMAEAAAFWWQMESLARAEIWRRGAALQRAEAQMRAHDAQLSALQLQLREVSSAAAERERAFAQERERMQALSAAEQSELRDARRYLGVVDSLGDADVVRMVRALNLEITQMATRLTASFRSEEHRGGEAVAAAYERTRESVGPIMAELLESIQHQDDPILLEISLQADMASFAAGIISAWDFQHQSNAVFNGIHKQMLRSETQAMCGRWRALTRQYSKQRLYNGRDLVAGFAHQLADRLGDLLLIAGSSVDAAQLRATSGAGLERIARAALELQRVVGEEIVACDHEILLVRVDEVFEPQQMEDAHENTLPVDAAAEVHVLCTVELGVRRCEKADEGAPDETRRTTLLRPKVVLETLVYALGLVEEDELLAEAEPRGSESPEPQPL